MKRFLVTILLMIMVCAAVSGSLAEQPDGTGAPLPVKVLILSKFEIGEMAGDFPGEAQYYYEEYLANAEAYDVPHGAPGTKLYYRDGVALCVLGMGCPGSPCSHRNNSDGRQLLERPPRACKRAAHGGNLRVP